VQPAAGAAPEDGPRPESETASSSTPQPQNDPAVVQRQETVAERDEAVLALAQENQMLKDVLSALDGGLRRLAAGDLDVRLSEAFPEEFEGLRGDFNQTVARLAEAFNAIAGHASALHGRGSELQTQARALMTGATNQTMTIAGLAARTSTLLESINRREAEIGHLATIAHAAALDLRKPKDVAAGAEKALRTVVQASAGMESVSDQIVQIALAANVTAMKAKIELAGSPQGPSAVAEDICRLALESAEAAKQAAVLARQASHAASEGEASVSRCTRELDAMAIYVQAIQERTAKLDSLADKRGTGLAALRSAVIMLAKSGREQLEQVEELSRNAGGVAAEIAALDQQVSRFTPVVTIQPRSVFRPQPPHKPKGPPPHLRLVKS
jgi:methyl-accepting chemotaxis protein